VPIVATLYRDRGAKFVTLLNRMGASRDTLSDTLSNLIENGLVMREPGHGLRPEYVLTPAGEAVGEACLFATREMPRLGLVDMALKKWPPLVLVAIGREATRFGEMKAALPGITPRALTGALRDLQQAGLVDRLVTETWPPGTSYALTALAREALPALDGVCLACENLEEGKEQAPG
jgi:DNA-binding HxlR family transcriptional regulator